MEKICASCDRKYSISEVKLKQSGNYCNDCLLKINAILDHKTLLNQLEKIEKRMQSEKNLEGDYKYLLREIEESRERLMNRWQINADEEVKKSLKFYTAFMDL